MKKCWIFCVIALILFWGDRVLAQEGFDYPFLEYAPDHGAWTIREALPSPEDARNKTNPTCWYPQGETILVGKKKEDLQAGKGEHEYHYLRKDVVPVWKWVVAHSKAECIHNDEGAFHGILMGKSRCRASYYSGWNAYCADCGGLINPFYVYGSRDKIRQLKTQDLSLDYYYLCPTCDHLEQGTGFEHVCLGISPNRYQVRYLPNGGDVSGRMQPSFHTYDNRETYEGESVTPVRTLNLNSYARKGYLFTGWNTKPDGSGMAFSDGQEILNLSEENYDEEKETGIVLLYAQWRKVTGSLLIDAGKGSYLGRSGITTVLVGYGEIYALAEKDVVAPAGFVVHFDVMGGKPVSDVRGRTSFGGWRLESPFHGILQGEEYQFFGEQGDADRVSATYRGEAILLPEPEKEGFSFGGWYYDTEYERLAGMEGDHFTPAGDVTLHARWVELTLRARLNLTAHEGKGAVDLAWHQKDGRNKSYLLYQKKEGEEFERIYDAEGVLSEPAEKKIKTAGETRVEITASGVYELEARGAQGQDAGTHKGGRGGSAIGRFYLEAGDVLTVFVGGQDGLGGGGKGREQGNGGGATTIKSARLGTLLVAGGGGGATVEYDGGAGGLEDGLRPDGSPEGEDGDAGGGAGYVGGIAGIYKPHVHTEACVHVHQGDTESGGPCYTEVKEEKTCHLVVKGPYIEWNKREDCLECIMAGRNGYGSVHPKCWWIEHHGCGKGTDYGSHGWWECLVCGRTSYQWGSGMAKPVAADHVHWVKSYVLSCDKEYDCGDPKPESAPSHGGSSFVREDLAITYSVKAGVQKGDGLAILRPVSVGFQETTELRGVFAPDLEAPLAIDLSTVEMRAAGDNVVKICFEEPMDRGTTYYHKAESYHAGTQELLSTSNVTVTEVVTGVAGYYYLIDGKKNTAVTRKNAENAKNILRVPEIEVKLSAGEKRYLHLAPADVAGNLGGTTSIELSAEKITACWDVETTPVTISSSVGERDYGSVAPGPSGESFVKADGKTPFLLSFEAVMLGSARQDCQIEKMTFRHEIQGGLGTGSYALLLPRGDVRREAERLSAEGIMRMTTGRDSLHGVAYVVGTRTEQMRRAYVGQGFTMDPSMHGKKLKVIPAAGATVKGKEYGSDAMKDEKNAILLIGDGEGPVIRGWDQLEEAFRRFHEGERDVVIMLSAEDALSGMKDFWLEVSQKETGEKAVYHADETWRIKLDLSGAEELFGGDVTLTVRASDRVGNETMEKHEEKEFTLTTEIIRVLAPHAPTFKRGESGILKIKVTGYPEDLEVQFPEDMEREGERLSRSITYITPLQTVREEIVFMVSLDLEEDGQRKVTVRARKGSEILESEPEFCTIYVAETVLGEIRTRLR